MPIYEYKREDGTTFEIEQRISEDALTTCPTTGQKVTRVISGGTGLIFKGSGFYLTDYARNGKNGSAESKSTPSETGNSDQSSTSEKKDSSSSTAGNSGASSKTDQG